MAYSTHSCGLFMLTTAAILSGSDWIPASEFDENMHFLCSVRCMPIIIFEGLLSLFGDVQFGSYHEPEHRPLDILLRHDQRG